MRTLTRFSFQIMEAVKNSIWPELSAAYGAQNWPLARKLHRVACQVSLWSSLGTVTFLFFAGDKIIAIWTHGRITVDEPTFRWLLLVIIANSFWYTSSVVTIASNTHERVAVVFLIGTAASLAIARLLMPHFGLSGAAMALLRDRHHCWLVRSRPLSENFERKRSRLFRFECFEFRNWVFVNEYSRSDVRVCGESRRIRDKCHGSGAPRKTGCRHVDRYIPVFISAVLFG